MSDTFLYFAYGSNMPTLRMQERCPSARAVGLATLVGYELRWHKPSIDRSGKCDVVPNDSRNSFVIGVLFEINNSERKTLDQDEAGYSPISLEVAKTNETTKATIYIAERTDPEKRPYTWYKELVLLGSIQHGLPDSYIEGIKGVAADVDPDPSRRLQKEALVERVRLDVASRAISSGSNLS